MAASLLDARMHDGAFLVREGHTYTLVALTPGLTAPRYYNAVPNGQVSHPAGPLMHRTGTEAGLHRRTLSVHIDQCMSRRCVSWLLGVHSHDTMHLVRIQPRS